MNKIKCNVTNCSHNKCGTCYSNRVNIGGQSALVDEKTCCGSFLNKLSYGELTNSVNHDGACDSVVCFVKGCKHNNNNLCSLDSIQIVGDNVEVYTETKCHSFAAE